MVVKLSDFLNTSFSTFSANDTNNTGITYPGAVVHNTTLTPGVGIGAGLDYQVETSDNNTETGMRLETVTTDVTAGSEDFDFVVKLMQNGAAASEKFRVTSAGNVNITGNVSAPSFLINGITVTSIGVGANAFTSATVAGANTAVGTGANAFTSATVAGANTAVGTAANGFTSATISGANTAVGTGANNFLLAVIAGANTAVGTGANNFQIAIQNGANTAVGGGANAFAVATFNAANTRPVGNTLSNSFTSRSTRRTLNFIPGSNITINVDDDSAGDRSNVTIASTGTGVTTFSAGTTGFTPSSATAGAVTLAGTLGISNGGTGQTSAHLAMAALEGSQRQSIATAGGTTTLTVNSPRRILFTGTQAQTVVLPVVSTLALGVYFEISTQNSTNSVQVQSSGGNAITTVGRGHIIRFTCILTTGTTAASWDWEVVGSYNGYAGNGSLVFANSPNLINPNITTGDLTISSTGNLLVNRTTSTVGLNTKVDVAGAVNASAFLVNGVALTSGGGGASVFSGNVGNNSANTFNIAHNLAKTFVIPAVRENSSGYYVYPDIRYTTPNHIVLEFVSAPTTNQYTVIVLG